MPALNMCSRWYTSDFHVVTIDIDKYFTSRYQALYPGVEKIDVKCL